MNSITVHLQSEEKDLAEMIVEVESNDFTGRGSAWFSVAALERSLAAFEEFPISSKQPPVIAGGDWNADFSKLVREQVHISVKPLGPLGQLVMTVRAFEPIHDYEDRELGCGVSVALLIEYAELGEFVGGMRELISGALSTFSIEIHGGPRGRVG